MIDPQWRRLYTESNLQGAWLLQARLEDQGIETMMLDQKDSSYGFGTIDIFVREDHYLKALQTLTEYIESLK